jgi:error-prone DNA polymerase
MEDYRALRLTLKRHPLALLRRGLEDDGFGPCRRLDRLTHGRRAKVAGLVTARQRPATAKGVIFLTLEDEGGIANLIVWASVFERFRRAILSATLLGVVGTVQREGTVIHVLAERLFDLTGRLSGLAGETPRPGGADARRRLGLASRDFH